LPVSLTGIRQPYDSHRNQGGFDREQDADDSYTADRCRRHRGHGDEQATGQAQPRPASGQVTDQDSNLILVEALRPGRSSDGPADRLPVGNSAGRGVIPRARNGKACANPRAVLSPGQFRGVLAQRPLVLLEVFAADPVKRQVDQPGDRFVAAPGAGQGQGEERCDRVVPGELLVRPAQRRHRLVEASEVAQGAPVLDQAAAQVVPVKAGREGLLVGGRGLGLAVREVKRARVLQQRTGVGGMLAEQVAELANRGLGVLPPGGGPPLSDGLGQFGHHRAESSPPAATAGSPWARDH
jgi:hypothetical protein